MREKAAIRAGSSADVGLLPLIELAAGRLFPSARIPQPDQTYPESELQRAAAEGLLFVAEAGGEIVGFVACRTSNGRLHIDEMSVHPAHGRQGVGRALVVRVIETARARRLTGVSLTTFADIAWNAPFYVSMGFRQLDESELDAPLREALLQERELGMTERIAMLLSVAPAAGSDHA